MTTQRCRKLCRKQFCDWYKSRRSIAHSQLKSRFVQWMQSWKVVFPHITKSKLLIHTKIAYSTNLFLMRAQMHMYSRTGYVMMQECDLKCVIKRSIVCMGSIRACWIKMSSQAARRTHKVLRRHNLQLDKTLLICSRTLNQSYQSANYMIGFSFAAFRPSWLNLYDFGHHWLWHLEHAFLRVFA